MNYDSEYYKDKYSYFLKYFCYMCDNEFCNKLSLTKNGLCDFKKSDLEECESCKKIITNSDDINLVEKFLQKKENIVIKIKELLNKCSDTSGKKNKAIIVLDIYTILYYNSYFMIIHPNFLIAYIKKLIEILQEYDTFMEIINENVGYNNNIIKYMVYIKDYIENNNINLDDIVNTQDSYDLFLLNFVNHLEKFYTDEINNKKSPSKIDNIIVDIDNINIVSLILDI